MPRRAVPLVPGQYYHIFNRGVNREAIFFERENYLFFLRRLRRHIVPVADVVSYCLMPNHFHLLVIVSLETGETSDVGRTSSHENFGILGGVGKEGQTSEISENLGGLGGGGLSNAMMKLSVSYTKAINKRYQRVGALFQGAFQSRHITENEDLLNLSRYIHMNPVLARLTDTPAGWEFSSYLDYCGDRHGSLPQPDVILNQFSSRQAYTDFCMAVQAERDDRLSELLIDAED